MDQLYHILERTNPLKISTRGTRNSIGFVDGQFIVNIWPSKNATAQFRRKII